MNYYGAALKPPTKSQAKIQQQIQLATGLVQSTIMACKIGDDIDPHTLADRAVNLAFECAARIVAKADQLGAFDELDD